MTDFESTKSLLRNAELDAVTGGFASESRGGCTGCTTPYLPSPWNPHPNSGGENPWLPGGIYHDAV